MYVVHCRTISASETVIYSAYRCNDDFATSPQRKIWVVDRVGSGDAFSAGLIYAKTQGYSIKESIDFASASCAFKHTVTKDINFADVDEIKSIINCRQGDVKR